MTTRQQEVDERVKKLYEDLDDIIGLPGVVATSSFYGYLSAARCCISMAVGRADEYKEEYDKFDDQ